MIAAVFSQFSGYFGVRADIRMAGWFIPEADRPLTHLSDHGRVESLLRGTQVNAKQETLFGRNAVWHGQFISRRAPSSPAGTVADVVVNRWIRVIQLPYAVWCFRANIAHKCQFSLPVTASDEAQNRRLWQRAMRMAGNKLIDFRAHPSTARATRTTLIMLTLLEQSMVRLTKSGSMYHHTDRASADFRQVPV